MAGREEIVWPEKERVCSGNGGKCVAGRRVCVAGRKETVWQKGKRVSAGHATSLGNMYKHWSQLEVNHSLV